jgi:hypothetical protein
MNFFILHLFSNNFFQIPAFQNLLSQPVKRRPLGCKQMLEQAWRSTQLAIESGLRLF